jgi:thymidylate synthase
MGAIHGSNMCAASDAHTRPQRVWVYLQNQTATCKTQAIGRLHPQSIELKIISIDAVLPSFIDDPEPYFPDPIDADLVLDHLKHPDLSHALAEKCRKAGIPMIASGKKPPIEGALTPRTCCALTQQNGLGHYGQHFGIPVYSVTVKEGRISGIETLRGAPCGATWDAAQRIIGRTVEEAATRIGLETQFFCVADPSAWDPITGKSPVHIAADLHKAALVNALKKAQER